MQSRQSPSIVAVLILTFVLASPAIGQPRRSAQAVGLPTAEDLKVGTFVQVEGRVEGELILADQFEVFVEPLEEQTIEADVQSLDPESMTLTVLGRIVAVDDSTKIRAEPDRTPITFPDIEVGQKVKAKGTIGEDGVLLARKIKVLEVLPDEVPGVQFEAAIEEVDLAKSTIVVLGVTVKFNPTTKFKIGT